MNLLQKLAELADTLDQTHPEIADKIDELIQVVAAKKVVLQPPYVRKRGNKFVILSKYTGKVLSEHNSKQDALDALKAMHVGR